MALEDSHIRGRQSITRFWGSSQQHPDLAELVQIAGKFLLILLRVQHPDVPQCKSSMKAHWGLRCWVAGCVDHSYRWFPVGSKAGSSLGGLHTSANGGVVPQYLGRPNGFAPAPGCWTKDTEDNCPGPPLGHASQAAHAIPGENSLADLDWSSMKFFLARWPAFKMFVASSVKCCDIVTTSASLDVLM